MRLICLHVRLDFHFDMIAYVAKRCLAMRLLDEVLLDILHHLNCETLDSIGITSRQFHAVSWKNMSTFCLRRVRNVYLTYEGVTVVHIATDRTETKFPEQLNVGRCLRSSRSRYVALKFDRNKGKRHFEGIVQGLLENASTTAAREVFFQWAILTPSGFALTTRLMELVDSYPTTHHSFACHKF